MKIVLATGIYPPSIGGPATYVRNLAKQLTDKGEEVTVLTYAVRGQIPESSWKVVSVPRSGGPLLRWWRYSRVLRQEAKDADVVYGFSAVSVGVPLLLSGLRKPKRVLRLGGDFLWERYTDLRGHKNLRQWYATKPFVTKILGWILRSLHHIVFSSQFQERIYTHVYRRLPRHGVIENALPESTDVTEHARHTPFRLLFFGRFVRFKNLGALLKAVADLPHVTLTLQGEGPIGKELSQMALKLRLKGRVTFLPPSAEEKGKVFREHDLLILPSLTEISPNAALEARASGLPVLLTEETGLSEDLRQGMLIRSLKTPEEITRAILEVEHGYEEMAKAAAAPSKKRTWEEVGEEHRKLFSSLVV